MISSIYEFKEHFGIVRMIAERDVPPFDEHILGHFEKGEDEFYRFSPSDGVLLTCRDLRNASYKAAQLNTD